MNKGNFDVQGLSILALGILGDNTALPELRKIVEKKTKPFVRGAAVLALGLLKDKASVPLLIKVVEKEEAVDPVTWLYAVQALGMIGDAQAAPVLQKVLDKCEKRLDLQYPHIII